MDGLAERFERNRAHLRAVAHRMLGSQSEADDAVQEAWLRLTRSDTSGVENLGGWLTTVVAHVCLDVLRSRKSRSEVALDALVPELAAGPASRTDPEREALLADSIGPALQVVLDALAPAERLAFVLHDMFALPFDEIATILGRSPTAVRQLASRARRRVQGACEVSSADRAREREIVAAFLAASRDGDFDALISVLDPDVVLRADAAAVEVNAARRAGGAPNLSPEVRGADTVANIFKGRAAGAQAALVDGAAGAVWAPGGQPRAAVGFTIARDRIVEIELLADPERLRQLDLAMLDD
jgi:RNA polymerase sigma-70 factor (ECF subfamily)